MVNEKQFLNLLSLMILTIQPTMSSMSVLEMKLLLEMCVENEKLDSMVQNESLVQEILLTEKFVENLEFVMMAYMDMENDTEKTQILNPHYFENLCLMNSFIKKRKILHGVFSFYCELHS